jgi:hypothetical protein
VGFDAVREITRFSKTVCLSRKQGRGGGHWSIGVMHGIWGWKGRSLGYHEPWTREIYTCICIRSLEEDNPAVDNLNRGSRRGKLEREVLLVTLFMHTNTPSGISRH